MKKQDPERLLCIVGSMNAGGAETFLMKMYRSIDRKKYQMDFLTMTDEEGFYDKEIIGMGGKIYNITPKSKNFIKSFFSIIRVVKKGEYKLVMRISEHSLSAIDLIAAKIGGANSTVFRSSNSNVVGGKISQYLHSFFKFLSIRIPDIKVAPSTEAAEFMFGKKSIARKEVNILKNAISVDDFVFENKKRNKVRNELNIEKEFVVGHVGRFNKQKNHDFLIDVFNEIVQIQQNSVLLLVGQGELEKEIKQKIRNLGLVESVIFMGVRNNVAEIMMAMDSFVFPSYFEGMPNTVIEAQATGLPCIISKNITSEVEITSLVKFLSIEDEASVWAKKIIDNDKLSDRTDVKSEFEENGYDVFQAAKIFEKVIFRGNEMSNAR